MTNSDAGRKAFEEWFSQWIENPSGYDIEEAFKGGEQASRKHQAEQQGVDKHELLLEVMRGMIGHNLPVEGREIVAMDVVDRLISKGYVTNPAEPVDLEVCAKALFEQEQNAPFPPKLTNIALYGQHPVTWEFINDSRFVSTCADLYRDKAKAVLSAANVKWEE